MPDCAQCGQPIGHHNGRDRRSGKCESCVECEGGEPVLFDAAELGLDPENDEDYWRRLIKRAARRGYV